jgi:hypothetical protein
MSRTEPDEATYRDDESIHRAYVLDVRIVETKPPDADGVRYRFEAPNHTGVSFGDAEYAELYADVYFDVNGFQEAGTGNRGVPPEVIQAGRDTLAAYFLAQPYADRSWVASFNGKKPHRIERYVSAVRERAAEIRDGVDTETATRDGSDI